MTAQGMSAGTAKTPKVVEGEARQPGSEGMRPMTSAKPLPEEAVTDALLPCPFCGHPEPHRHEADEDIIGAVAIGCSGDGCGALGPFIEALPANEKTWAEACIAWNTRAMRATQPTAMPEEEDAVERLCAAANALVEAYGYPESDMQPLIVELDAARAACDRAALAALSAPIPLKPKVDEDAGWVPSIGERVVVTSTKEWASDWVDAAGQPLQLWVAGVQAMAGGGFNVTVADETQWPLKPSAPFSGAGLTDGFIVGRPDEQDDLAPEHIAARLEDGE